MMLDSTCATFRIPGIVVLTSEFERINRSASSVKFIFSGNVSLSKLILLRVSFRFSGVKYELRQSPFDHELSNVSVPVRDPSSKGTRAITAIFFSLQRGNNLSSGA